MIYSYTQLSQYLACPRRYRYRYLDGWKEKENRAGLLFGRAFETALGALFRREDACATFFEQWAPYQHLPLDRVQNEPPRSEEVRLYARCHLRQAGDLRGFEGAGGKVLDPASGLNAARRLASRR